MPRSARDLGEDGFGFGGEAWLGLDGLAGGKFEAALGATAAWVGRGILALAAALTVAAALDAGRRGAVAGGAGWSNGADRAAGGGPPGACAAAGRGAAAGSRNHGAAGPVGVAAYR